MTSLYCPRNPKIKNNAKIKAKRTMPTILLTFLTSSYSIPFKDEASDVYYTYSSGTSITISLLLYFWFYLSSRNYL